MSGDAKPGGFSLRRWSSRKLAEAARNAPERGTELPQANAATDAATRPPPAPPATAPVESASPVPELPPLDTLTPQSDFTPFMRPEVEPSLHSAALRKLFADPHFNVMDGLDVYIDDYSKPDPITPDIVRQLVQARYIFAPPQTRVNAEGFVEDVPAEELAQAQAAPPVEQAEATSLPPPGESANDAGAPTEGVPTQIVLPLDAPQDVKE